MTGISTHMQRGDLAPRPRTPKYVHARVTTTTPEVLVAADASMRTLLYHLTFSSDDASLSTVTLKFGTNTVFVFHMPGDGGTMLLNLLGTELATAVNESVSVTLSASGGLDVTLCYIQI